MGAVEKLRFGYFALAGMALLAAISALFGIGAMVRQQNGRAESELPVLLAIHRISQTALETATTARLVYLCDDIRPIDDLAGRIAAQHSALLAEIEAIAAIELAGRQDDIARAIDRIRLHSRATRDTASAQLIRRQAFAASLDDLNARLRHLAAASTIALADAGQTASAPETGLRDAPNMHKLLAINNHIEKVFSDARALALATGATEFSDLKRLLELDFGKLSEAVAGLPGDPPKSRIAARADSVHDLISGAGFLVDKAALIDLRSQTEQQTEALFASLEQLRQASSEFAERQRAAARRLNAELADIADAISTFLIGISFAALATATVLAKTVVDRRISQRLDTLRENANRIETGRLDARPALAGADVIAEIGGALDRLRIVSEEQNKLQERLRTDLRAAEKSAAAKSDFLTMMSHEIRTPLNSIMGIFELLERADIPDRQKSRARKGILAADELHQLLSKILDAARTEAYSLETIVEPVALQELVAFLTLSLEAMITRSGKPLQGSVRVVGPLPDHLMTDPFRVRQILTNLIDNAVRFTDTGHISAEVGRSAAGDAIEFRISDSGIGIPDSELDQIFEPFRQTERGLRLRRGGSGLGLSICRHLAASLNGTLRCESRIGRGSTFVLALKDAAPGMARAPGQNSRKDKGGAKA